MELSTIELKRLFEDNIKRPLSNIKSEVDSVGTYIMFAAIFILLGLGGFNQSKYEMDCAGPGECYRLDKKTGEVTTVQPRGGFVVKEDEGLGCSCTGCEAE